MKQKTMFAGGKNPRRRRAKTRRKKKPKRPPLELPFLPPSVTGARYTGGLCLDPMAGSGMFAVACLHTQRRFIINEQNPAPMKKIVEVIKERRDAGEFKPQYIKHSGEQMKIHIIDFSDHPRQEFGEGAWYDFWTDGHSYITTGDCITVMRTMPNCAVDLIYTDPPYAKQKHFGKKKSGDDYSDYWAWDDAAEERMEEIRSITPERIKAAYEKAPAGYRYSEEFKGADNNIPLEFAQDIELGIEWARRVDGDYMASYLSFMALYILECHRVCGGIDLQPAPFWQPR